MLNLPDTVRDLFVQAGWAPHRQVKTRPEAPVQPSEVARLLIAEFGGLSVGHVGAGVETAASDIKFYSALRPEVDSVAVRWRERLGPLASFATAHNDHMILFVGDSERFYVFTDPDSQMYEVGTSFGVAAERVLIGLTYGSALASDASQESPSK